MLSPSSCPSPPFSNHYIKYCPLFLSKRRALPMLFAAGFDKKRAGRRPTLSFHFHMYPSLLRLRLGIHDDRRNLGQHIINIFKHSAFRCAKAAGTVNMFYDLLVLNPYFIKKLADGL